MDGDDKCGINFAGLILDCDVVNNITKLKHKKLPLTEPIGWQQEGRDSGRHSSAGREDICCCSEMF